MEWHIYCFIPFSTIDNIFISLKRSNFTLVFFKAACHANPRAERNFAESSLCILIKIFLKFSNTSAKNSVLLWTYKSWYPPKFFISKSLQTLFGWAKFASVISSYSPKFFTSKSLQTLFACARFVSVISSIFKGIVKWAEPCKCVTLLISRILWDFDIWYSTATFCHNFFFPVYTAPFQWSLLIYIGKKLVT